MAAVAPYSSREGTSSNVRLFRGQVVLRHRLLPSIWLGFLVLPLVSTWDQRSRSTIHDVVVTAVAALFAGLFAYVSSLSDDARSRWTIQRDTPVAATFLVTPIFLSFFDNGGWAYIFVYALFPVMRLWSQPVRYRVVMGMGALTAVVAATAGASSSEVVAPACLVLGCGASWLAFGRLLEANAMLEQAQEDKAQAAVAEERLRFARDLHDLLGHSLSVITLKSEVAGRLLAFDPERAGVEVAEIEQVARRALKEVREAVGGYRQTTLSVELAGARAALAAGQVTWTEEVDAELALPEEVEAALAWTVREGVTNVLRHSHAATCALRIGIGPSTATATIADNGVGGTGACGNGLRGLHERIAAVGGALTAGPADDGGYRLTVSVPLPDTDPAAPVAATTSG